MNFLAFREPLCAWTHFAWFLLALPGTYLLWRRSRGDRVKQFSMLLYGLGLVLCFGGSTLYHGVQSSNRQIAFFETLDYLGIYFLIAGTYTPAVGTVLQGMWKWSFLALVWSLAATGIILRLVDLPIHPIVSTSLYLGLGWIAVLCYFELARALSHRAMFPVVLGGVLYSIGAVFNMLDLPVWFFTAHEFMHLCVMGGSLAHYWFMATAVVPFERLPAAAEAAAALPREPFPAGLVPAQSSG